MNIQSIVINELAKKLSDKFEEIFIEGLRLKGFEFDSRQELETFVKENCECIDDFLDGAKYYYINGNPFLLHKYEIEMPEITNNCTIITANGGSFAYL